MAAQLHHYTAAWLQLRTVTTLTAFEPYTYTLTVGAGQTNGSDVRVPALLSVCFPALTSAGSQLQL